MICYERNVCVESIRHVSLSSHADIRTVFRSFASSQSQRWHFLIGRQCDCVRVHRKKRNRNRRDVSLHLKSGDELKENMINKILLMSLKMRRYCFWLRSVRSCEWRRRKFLSFTAKWEQCQRYHCHCIQSSASSSLSLLLAAVIIIKINVFFQQEKEQIHRSTNTFLRKRKWNKSRQSSRRMRKGKMYKWRRQRQKNLIYFVAVCSHELKVHTTFPRPLPISFSVVSS